MHTTPLVALEPGVPSRGRRASGERAKLLGKAAPVDGTGLALAACMMHTVMLAFACVLVAAAPAMAKKRQAHPHAAKTKKAKRTESLAHVRTAPPPTRVAAVEQHPTPPPEVAAPPAAATATAPAPSPPVEHGPLGPQATDDEVPGSRMKR